MPQNEETTQFHDSLSPPDSFETDHAAVTDLVVSESSLIIRILLSEEKITFGQARDKLLILDIRIVVLMSL